MICPNCDATINDPDTPCPECEHDGGDPDCQCAACSFVPSVILPDEIDLGEGD